MNINLPRRPANPDQVPFKHVIEEYRHKAQQVSCVCGWQGSTAAPIGGRSAWDRHKAEARASAEGQS